MSYEPRLVIRKADLDSLSHIFENDWEWEDNPETIQAMKLLRDIQKNYIGFIIDGKQWVTIRPELTGFNKFFREKLEELEIEYVVDND